MPFTYSPQYRAMVIAQIHDGKPVAVIAAELGLNPATIYRWKKQDRVDQGLEAGTPTSQSSELRGQGNVGQQRREDPALGCAGDRCSSAAVPRRALHPKVGEPRPGMDSCEASPCRGTGHETCPLRGRLRGHGPRNPRGCRSAMG